MTFFIAVPLPLSPVAGVQLVRRVPFGLLLGAVYLFFLSFMMTALTAKVLAMAFLGQNVVPIIFLIPSQAAATVIFVILLECFRTKKAGRRRACVLLRPAFLVRAVKLPLRFSG